MAGRGVPDHTIEGTNDPAPFCSFDIFSPAVPPQ